MYDPVRIRSHPGVRSDLFSRPLSNALVTDFFGGVADVDVVESQLFQDLASSSHDHQDLENLFNPLPDTTQIDTNTSRPVNWAGSRLPVRGGSHAVDERRAWVGLGMVGVLAGFVLLQTRFRTASNYKDRKQ